MHWTSWEICPYMRCCFFSPSLFSFNFDFHYFSFHFHFLDITLVQLGNSSIWDLLFCLTLTLFTFTVFFGFYFHCFCFGFHFHFPTFTLFHFNFLVSLLTLHYCNLRMSWKNALTQLQIWDLLFFLTLRPPRAEPGVIIVSAYCPNQSRKSNREL